MNFDDYNGDVIRVPRGKAREYAALSCNLCLTCPHGCTYCYCPQTLKTTAEKFHQPPEPRGDILKRLERDCRRLAALGCRERIHFAFIGDPWAAGAEATTAAALEIVNHYGLYWQTLTKRGIGGVRPYLDLYQPLDHRGRFGVTLTCLDGWEQWEPGADGPISRVSALYAAADACIPTWVSLEPVIDPAAVLRMIPDLAETADFLAVGKLNYHPHALDINWRQFALEVVIELMAAEAETGVAWRLKDSLAALLPCEFPRAGGRICRVCGYTDRHGCPAGCEWVEADLCSECAGERGEAA